MKKRLTRINDSKSYLGGVSQGLAEYFSMDVVIFRVIFIILFFTPFPSIFTYLVLWAILPQKQLYGVTPYGEITNLETSNLTTMSKNNQNGSFIGGAILITIGVILSFETILDIDLWHYIWKLWPLGLVAMGVWLIVKDRNDSNFGNFSNNE